MKVNKLFKMSLDHLFWKPIWLITSWRVAPNGVSPVPSQSDINVYWGESGWSINSYYFSLNIRAENLKNCVEKNWPQRNFWKFHDIIYLDVKTSVQNFSIGYNGKIAYFDTFSFWWTGRWSTNSLSLTLLGFWSGLKTFFWSNIGWVGKCHIHTIMSISDS